MKRTFWIIYRSGIVFLLCLFIIGMLCQCSDRVSAIPDLQFDGNLELFGKNYISTSLYERDIAISPGGDEIVYTLGNHKQTVRALVSIRKEQNGWGSKEILPFSGRYNDIEPFFAPDGSYLYFASDRPMGKDSSRTDYNLWKVERKATGWSLPVPMDTLINTTAEEFFPSVSASGNLYFTTIREDGPGREDIYMSELSNGKYLKPVALDSAINTLTFEFNAYIHPEENLIVFSSYGRQDGYGGGDLYYSKKDEKGSWQKAVNMGPVVNSPNLDYSPFIDITREVFYFTSDRAAPASTPFENVNELEVEAARVLNGMGNIYRIALDKTDLN